MAGWRWRAIKVGVLCTRARVRRQGLLVNFNRTIVKVCTKVREMCDTRMEAGFHVRGIR